jgi:hypothetical protein
VEVYFSPVREKFTDVLLKVSADGMGFGDGEGGRNAESEVDSMHPS